MLKQAEVKGWLRPAGSLQTMQWDLSILERLSALGGTVAFIFHDLQHPLTAILANAEFLTRSDIGEMEKDDCYQEIRWAIDRINEEVSSLLACSRGRDTLRPAPRNIEDTVERAIRMTSVRPEFRRIAIKYHHEGTAVGWFDANRLERVVTNLVVNACEAVAPESGQIVINTIGNRAYLQIGIWDNGAGIPPMVRESVFQPFVSYGKTEGSGLGLAIAKRIVEEHGGVIYLDEKNKTGTLFTIMIPFAIPEEATPVISTNPPDSPSGHYRKRQHHLGRSAGGIGSTMRDKNQRL